MKKGNKSHVESGTVWRMKITKHTSHHSCGVGGQGSSLILCMWLENRLGLQDTEKAETFVGEGWESTCTCAHRHSVQIWGDAMRVNSGGSLSRRKQRVTNSFCFSPGVWYE